MKSVGGYVYLSSDEMRLIDDETVSSFGVDVLSLMENAGSRTAELARVNLEGNVAGKEVVCLVGKGNNGGDGLVAARHLYNWGAQVKILLGADRREFRDVPAKQLAIAEKMGIPVSDNKERLVVGGLIIDALLGYNATGNPRGPIADLIRLANSAGNPILALDIPSGLDPTTGTPNQPCIVAKFTVTLGFPKVGFLTPASRRHVGELHLADIGIPKEIYARYPRMQRVFERQSVVRVPLSE